MTKTFEIIQIILAVILMVVVLMQQKGSGLGLVFGGDSNFYRSRRGLENMLHWATIVIAAMFCIIAIATVYFS